MGCKFAIRNDKAAVEIASFSWPSFFDIYFLSTSTGIIWELQIIVPVTVSQTNQYLENDTFFQMKAYLNQLKRVSWRERISLVVGFGKLPDLSHDLNARSQKLHLELGLLW